MSKFRRAIKLVALSGILTFLFAAMTAQSAYAAGPFLQVGGRWEIVQSNGYSVLINITQMQDRLTAFASHSGGSVWSNEATGFVQGPNFEITISWSNGTKGRYTGTLSYGWFTSPLSGGFLRGQSVDLNNPSSVASWESQGRLFRVA